MGIMARYLQYVVVTVGLALPIIVTGRVSGVPRTEASIGLEIRPRSVNTGDERDGHTGLSRA